MRLRLGLRLGLRVTLNKRYLLERSWLYEHIPGNRQISCILKTQ